VPISVDTPQEILKQYPDKNSARALLTSLTERSKEATVKRLVVIFLLLGAGYWYLSANTSGTLSISNISSAQSTPDEAITRMIQLLEAKQYQRFIEECVSPFELKKIQKKHSISEVIKEFEREQKDEVLLDILRRIRDQRITPLINPMNNTAHYWVPDHPNFRLSNINGKWYLENEK
jgi:hypothetical protein